MNLLFALLLSGTANVAAQEARPIGNPGLWITTEDYPMAAMREEMEGVTGVQMAISMDGLVTGCTVTLSSGHPILDDLTCNLLSLRARYEPAKDRRGRAIASQDDRRVRWQLPKDAIGVPRMPAPQPFAIIVDFDINEKGEVENCTTNWRSGIFNGPDFCDAAGSYQMEPIRNADGTPVRKHATYRTSMTIEAVPAAERPTAGGPTPPKGPSN